MAARVLTSLAHGTFFGVGSVVATGLVPPTGKRLGDRDHVHRPDRRNTARRAVRRLARPAVRLARDLLGGDARSASSRSP